MTRLLPPVLIGLIAGCSPAGGPTPAPQEGAKSAAGDLPAHNHKASPTPDLGADPLLANRPKPPKPEPGTESNLGPAADASDDVRRASIVALLTDGKSVDDLRIVATEDNRPFDSGLVRRMAPRVATPLVRLLPPTVDGDLPKEVVRRVLRSRIGPLRKCFQDGLDIDVQLAGRVTLELQIGERGKVSQARVAKTNLGNEAVGKCMAVVAKRLRFPKPRDAKPVEVTVDIDLEPGL